MAVIGEEVGEGTEEVEEFEKKNFVLFWVLFEAVDIREFWFVEVGMGEEKVKASHARYARKR